MHLSLSATLENASQPPARNRAPIAALRVLARSTMKAKATAVLALLLAAATAAAAAPAPAAEDSTRCVKEPTPMFGAPWAAGMQVATHEQEWLQNGPVRAALLRRKCACARMPC